jgi:hypothetical protein
MAVIYYYVDKPSIIVCPTTPLALWERVGQLVGYFAGSSCPNIGDFDYDSVKVTHAQWESIGKL